MKTLLIQIGRQINRKMSIINNCVQFQSTIMIYFKPTPNYTKYNVVKIRAVHPIPCCLVQTTYPTDKIEILYLLHELHLLYVLHMVCFHFTALVIPNFPKIVIFHRWCFFYSILILLVNFSRIKYSNLSLEQ